jgi:DNA mismatch repair protein MutS2
VASDAKHFEDVLADLEASRLNLEQERQSISQNRKEISRLQKELRDKTEKLDQSKERILQNANQEAGRILAEAKEIADETIRKYTKWAKSDANIRQMEKERANLRNQINKHQGKTTVKPNTRKTPKLSAKDLMVGADVHIISLNAKGTVSTLPNDKGDLFVQAGLLKTQVNIKDLELLPDEKRTNPSPSRTGGGQIRMDKAAAVHQDVNLIGMTVDEAMPVLTKYLDDAYLAHLSQVTIIHGRGTGALRKAVHHQLDRLKYIKSYRLGEFGEGDMGVTIVVFK